MTKTRRSYSREFKEEAVRLVVGGGRTGHEVALELGISPSSLNRWRKRLEAGGPEAFPGKGRLKASDEEMRRLERENDILRQEREILKKALAIFSKGPK
jgi:transposase